LTPSEYCPPSRSASYAAPLSKERNRQRIQCDHESRIGQQLERIGDRHEDQCLVFGDESTQRLYPFRFHEIQNQVPHPGPQPILGLEVTETITQDTTRAQIPQLTLQPKGTQGSAFGSGGRA
jgi:hypothetical protein